MLKATRVVADTVAFYMVYDMTSSHIDETGKKNYRETKKFMAETDQLLEQIGLVQKQLVKEVLTSDKSRQRKVQSSNIDEFFTKLGVNDAYRQPSSREDPFPLQAFQNLECLHQWKLGII